MRVLITGAFGYLGLAVVQRLAREHEVVAWGRAPREHCRDDVQRVLPSSVERVYEDVSTMRPFVADAVVHLAGGGASGGSIEKPRAAMCDNVLSTAHVLECAPQSARKIFASSIYVYGEIGGPRGASEHDKLAPCTLYGAQKVVAESMWTEARGLSLRFSHIYGAGSGVDFHRAGVTEKMARHVALGEPFKMHGDGSQAIDIVHIDDACEAIAIALKLKCDLYGHLNIGGNPIEVRQLLEVFKRAASPPGDSVVAPAAANRPKNHLDATAAHVALDWKPRVDVERGARGLVDMFLRRA